MAEEDVDAKRELLLEQGYMMLGHMRNESADMEVLVMDSGRKARVKNFDIPVSINESLETSKLCLLQVEQHSVPISIVEAFCNRYLRNIDTICSLQLAVY